MHLNLQTSIAKEMSVQVANGISAGFDHKVSVFLREIQHLAPYQIDLILLKLHIEDKKMELSKQRAKIIDDLRNERNNAREELRLSRINNLLQAKRNLEMLFSKNISGDSSISNRNVIRELQYLKLGLQELETTLK